MEKKNENPRNMNLLFVKDVVRYKVLIHKKYENDEENRINPQ